MIVEELDHVSGSTDISEIKYKFKYELTATKGDYEDENYDHFQVLFDIGEINKRIVYVVSTLASTEVSSIETYKIIS